LQLSDLLLVLTPLVEPLCKGLHVIGGDVPADDLPALAVLQAMARVLTGSVPLLPEAEGAPRQS